MVYKGGLLIYGTAYDEAGPLLVPLPLAEPRGVLLDHMARGAELDATPSALQCPLSANQQRQLEQ